VDLPKTQISLGLVSCQDFTINHLQFYRYPIFPSIIRFCKSRLNLHQDNSVRLNILKDLWRPRRKGNRTLREGNLSLESVGDWIIGVPVDGKMIVLIPLLVRCADTRPPISNLSVVCWTQRSGPSIAMKRRRCTSSRKRARIRSTHTLSAYHQQSERKHVRLQEDQAAHQGRQGNAVKENVT